MKKPNVKDIRIDYHAKRRFWERYGMRFNHSIKMQLINMIRSGEAELLQKVSNSRSIFRVEFDGTMMDIVYDKRRVKIITVLFSENKE